MDQFLHLVVIILMSLTTRVVVSAPTLILSSVRMVRLTIIWTPLRNCVMTVFAPKDMPVTTSPSARARDAGSMPDTSRMTMSIADMMMSLPTRRNSGLSEDSSPSLVNLNAMTLAIVVNMCQTVIATNSMVMMSVMSLNVPMTLSSIPRTTIVFSSPYIITMPKIYFQVFLKELVSMSFFLALIPDTASTA